MNNNYTLNFKNILIRFFFLLSAIVILVKAESGLYYHTDYCYHYSQTVIELVVSEGLDYNFGFRNINDPQDEIADFSCAGFDFSLTQSHSLIQFNNYVLHQLKSLSSTLHPNHSIISILQKNNTWHQSSDEDPSFLS